MSNPKDMTDQQLNVALAELTGFPKNKFTPHYCNESAASLLVQAAACKANSDWYIQELSKIVGADDYWEYGRLDHEGISLMLNATPRQRAEAAYMTLKEASQ